MRAEGITLAYAAGHMGEREPFGKVWVDACRPLPYLPGMTKAFNRNRRASSSLEALDSAYLQGLMQIIDAAVENHDKSKDLGDIATHLIARNILTKQEVQALTGYGSKALLRWKQGLFNPKPERSLQALDNLRGELARRASKGDSR